MPKVGNQQYSYSRKGRQAAKRASKRTGKPIRKAKKGSY